ncbi:hypothetical protein V8E53_003582 [Lactarius tabidus]
MACAVCASVGLSGVNSFTDHDDNLLPIATNTQDAEDAYPVAAAPAAAMVVPSTPTRCATSRTPPSLKRARGSGVEAIQGLTALTSQFSNNICKVLTGGCSERMPKHHTKADIKAADAFTAPDDIDVEFCEMRIQGNMDEVKAPRSAF